MHVARLNPLYHENFILRPETSISRPGRHTREDRSLRLLDQWFPEAAAVTALRGAESFLSAAIGWHPSEKKKFGRAQHSAWETIQRSHAIANGCYVAVTNRVGHEAPAGGDGMGFGPKLRLA